MKKDNQKLARQLVLDELFDLTLYKKMRGFSTGETALILDKLILVEEGHLNFWRNFFKLNIRKLNFTRKIKLSIILILTRLFGEHGVHLVLESIEIYGIRKYLAVWDKYRGEELGEAVKNILLDEFKHEDEIVSQLSARKIHPERVRDIFLGFNDGLVEILGAVAGFFAAFQAASSVLLAGLTVAVAGSISMAASAYASIHSGKEVENIETGKKIFLGEEIQKSRLGKPLSSALVVGTSYFIGAMVPILPVFFGAANVYLSILSAAAVIIVVSYLVAFLSGMNALQRIVMNLIIIAVAVTVTYSIGFLAKNYLGVSL